MPFFSCVFKGKLNRVQSRIFDGGIKFYIVVLIITVFALISSILYDAKVIELDIGYDVLLGINTVLFTMGVFSMWLSENTVNNYYCNLFDEKIESNPIEVFKLSIEKLNHTNSQIIDIVHLLAYSKIEINSKKNIKSNRMSLKGKELIELAKTLTSEINGNIKLLEKKLENKSEEYYDRNS